VSALAACGIFCDIETPEASAQFAKFEWAVCHVAVSSARFAGAAFNASYAILIGRSPEIGALSACMRQNMPIFSDSPNLRRLTNRYRKYKNTLDLPEFSWHKSSDGIYFSTGATPETKQPAMR
jgi:hypothetical protein